MIRLAQIVATGLLLAACGDSSKPGVVLYSSIDDNYARLISREFEKDTGIRVDIVTDSEAAKSTGLVQRLIAEKARPVADVFWSGDPMRAFKLEAAGVGRSVGSGPARVRLIVFNNKIVGPSQVPGRIEDLALPDHAKRACIANPLYGSTSMHAASLMQSWGRERAEKFFAGFATNGGRMLASNGEVKRRVANGEFAFGVTDSDDVAVGLGEGKPISFVIPDQNPDDMGAVLVPAVAVLIDGAPDQTLGSKLAAYIVSEKVQRLLAESEAEFLPTLSTETPPLPHLGLVLAKLKLAPVMTAETAGKFETWEREFLESWAGKQFQ